MSGRVFLFLLQCDMYTQLPPIYHAAGRYCRSHLPSPRFVTVCRKLCQELRIWSDLRWPMTDISNISKIVQQLSSWNMQMHRQTETNGGTNGHTLISLYVFFAKRAKIERLLCEEPRIHVKLAAVPKKGTQIIKRKRKLHHRRCNFYS
jgi:hypothetical protein